MSDFADGNRLTLLESGREYFPALERACDSALHEIHLEAYLYEDDAAGQQIAAALKRAARRGVMSHVLIDGFGSRKLPRAFVDDLTGAGVEVLVYRPEIGRVRSPRQRLRRMHRKLAVIDGRVALVGGINVIDDMHTPGHTPPRFDYAVQVEGPLLEAIHAAAKRLWVIVQLSQLRGGWPDFESPAPDTAVRGDQRAAFLVRDNLWHRDDIEDAYLQAIAGAGNEVLIASSYFLPGLAFRRALVDAVGRGVRVLLLLQGRVEYRLLHYASRALYGALLDAGVEIHEYHRSFLHAKVAVVDRVWATVGSSNIDPFSLLLAREANIVVTDALFAGELRASLQRAMDDGAQEVRAENWHRTPLPARVAHWGCYGLARVLTGVSAYGQAGEFV